MIYEVRTYDLKVRALPEVIKRFGESVDKRQELSTLSAFWYTDIGPLYQIIHVWQYEDAAERSQVRSEATKHDWWPPKIGNLYSNKPLSSLFLGKIHLSLFLEIMAPITKCAVI